MWAQWLTWVEGTILSVFAHEDVKNNATDIVQLHVVLPVVRSSGSRIGSQ